jgi:adenylate cyclase
MALAGVGINCVAGLLVWLAYARLLPAAAWGGGPSGPGGGVPFGRALAESLALWLALWAVGFVATRRMSAEIEGWYARLQAGAAPEEVPARVRQYVVNQPLILSAVSFGFWVVAGLIFGGYLMRSVAVFLTLVGLAGVLSVALALQVLELAWRPIVPVFIPDGKVSAVKALRLSVFSRLLMFMLLVGLYPTGLLAGAALSHVSAMMATPMDPGATIAGLERLVAVYVGISVLFAVGMALSVTRAIVGPLRELRRAMDGVAHGDLDARVQVTTSDEIGALAERFNDMVAGLRRGQQVRQLLDQYVSPEVARQAVEAGADLGGRLARCSALFCDIRDFTPLTRQVEPARLIELLNAFMGAMIGVVVAEGGIVAKFGGDALMAVFGAPVSPAWDHAARAVRAALEMRRRREDLNRDLAGWPGVPLRMGIGVATGEVVAGNVGAQERMEYTVIGDAVNLAARLQDATKDLGRDLIIAAETAADPSLPADLTPEPLPPLALAGVDEPVHAFAL